MTLKQIPLQGGKGPTGDPGDPGPGGKGWGWTYKSGWWYGASGMREIPDGALVSSNSIYLHQCFIGSTKAFDRMAFAIKQQSGSTTKLAIYADDGQAYPGAKVLETSEVTTNLPQQHILTINQTLQMGLYWLAFFSTGNVNVECYTISSGMPCLGVPGLPVHATGGYGFIGAYSLARTYSLGFPASFPTEAPPVIGSFPKIILRAA